MQGPCVHCRRPMNAAPFSTNEAQRKQRHRTVGGTNFGSTSHIQLYLQPTKRSQAQNSGGTVRGIVSGTHQLPVRPTEHNQRNRSQEKKKNTAESSAEPSIEKSTTSSAEPFAEPFPEPFSSTHLGPIRLVRPVHLRVTERRVLLLRDDAQVRTGLRRVE